jgi:NADH dehydrogenase
MITWCSLGSETIFPKTSNFAHLVFTPKNLKDALLLRNHIIDMLERADIESDPVKREQMLNFVIVGGGLSGIETAAELNAFFRKVVTSTILT